MQGKFITFEGTDGVGKSTQIRRAGDYLKRRGVTFLVTREPGGCDISEQIRRILLDKSNAEMVPQTEALLYAAARSQLMSSVILPALREGKSVLCDRFIDSSVAYQGYGRGLGRETVMRINEPALFGRMPDLTILLTISPEEAFRRKNGVHDDRIEESGSGFFSRTEKGFAAAAEEDPARVRVVEAGGKSIEEVAGEIRKLLDGLYGW
ncbi:MAG: dTMP kinase [Eubacteriales bacterium]|nr:dTMP kinase [Eubacteriales bacterium]